MTVWIYVNTKDHLRVFSTELAASQWYEENDPEGVAFEYPIEP